MAPHATKLAPVARVGGRLWAKLRAKLRARPRRTVGRREMAEIEMAGMRGDGKLARQRWSRRGRHPRAKVRSAASLSTSLRCAPRHGRAAVLVRPPGELCQSAREANQRKGEGACWHGNSKGPHATLYGRCIPCCMAGAFRVTVQIWCSLASSTVTSQIKKIGLKLYRYMAEHSTVLLLVGNRKRVSPSVWVKS